MDLIQLVMLRTEPVALSPPFGDYLGYEETTLHP